MIECSRINSLSDLQLLIYTSGMTPKPSLAFILVCYSLRQSIITPPTVRRQWNKSTQRTKRFSCSAWQRNTRWHLERGRCQATVWGSHLWHSYRFTFCFRLHQLWMGWRHLLLNWIVGSVRCVSCVASIKSWQIFNFSCFNACVSQSSCSYTARASQWRRTRRRD